MKALEHLTRRDVLKLGALGLMAPYIAACGGDDNESAQNGTGGGGAERTTVRFRLDWVGEARFAPFYLGQERGYYDEENLDVEIIVGSGSPDSIKFLGTGNVDVALADGMLGAQARSLGVPLTSIGVFLQTLPYSVLSLASDPIRTPDDLPGKTIGATQGSAADLGFGAMLEAQGIDPADVQVVDIGFGVQPLLVGQVDGRSAFAFNEIVEVRGAGEEAFQFLMADYGVVGYSSAVFTNDRFGNDNPEALAGFVRATQRAMEDTVDDPDAAVDAVLAAVPDADEETERAKITEVIPFYSSDETEANGFLAQSQSGWETTLDTALALGLVEDPEQAPAPEDMFTNEFVEA